MEIKISGQTNYHCTTECSECCKSTTIPVYPTEALEITELFNKSIHSMFRPVENGAFYILKKNQNGCIFLENGCNIYKKDKTKQPYICRTFPLRLDIALQEDRIDISTTNIASLSMCNAAANKNYEKTMAIEDIKEAAERKIKNHAILKTLALEDFSDENSYAAMCQLFYNHFTLEDAVKTLRTKGIHKLI
jgi:Fe-S-cluster containining protein